MNKKLILTVSFIVLFLCPVFSQVKTDDSLDKLIRFADYMFSDYSYGKARELYIQALTSYPDNKYKEYAEFMIGKTHIYDSGWGYYFGVKQLEKYIKQYPEGKYVEEAKKLIFRAGLMCQDSEPLNESPEERMAYKYIAFGDSFLSACCVYGESGWIYYPEQLEQAFYWYKKVMAECAGTWVVALAQFRMGDAYMKQEKESEYEKAVVEYQKVFDNYPDNLYYRGLRRNAMKKIGDVYLNNLRNKKLAIVAYEKLYELDKNDPNSYYQSYAKAQINYLK